MPYDTPSTQGGSQNPLGADASIMDFIRALGADLGAVGGKITGGLSRGINGPPPAQTGIQAGPPLQLTPPPTPPQGTPAPNPPPVTSEALPPPQASMDTLAPALASFLVPILTGAGTASTPPPKPSFGEQAPTQSIDDLTDFVPPSNSPETGPLFLLMIARAIEDAKRAQQSPAPLSYEQIAPWMQD